MTLPIVVSVRCGFDPMHENVRRNHIQIAFGLSGLRPMFLANLCCGSKERAGWKVSKTLLWKLNFDIGWECVQRAKASTRTILSQIHLQQHVLVCLSLREYIAPSHGML